MLKGCAFCYNASGPDDATQWRVDELVPFIVDCAANGMRAVSFGVREPLQFDGLFELLESLRSRLFRSITTKRLFRARVARQNRL